MIDPLLPLITNLSTRKREYVLFLGAGVSKDAGVKSGWDILIETLKPLYIRENKLKELPEGYYSKIQEWYLNHKKYRKLGYSQLLELMHEGDIERREHLKQYFEDARPGEAHRQLALMVANSLVRFIFTTNFDDLVEKALEEMNLDYDVIYSDDILSATKSWDKVETCRVYKLHGDYNTGKVRNTITELRELDPLIAEDFQYIIDRHGLIVIGYAGRDEGVMNHFLKRKPYAYPFYWQYRKHPDRTEDFKLYHALIDKYKNDYNRKIHFIKCQKASDFLAQINTGIEKLERALLVSREDQYAFRDYIARNDSKKIRALTLELCNKFHKLYEEYVPKEGQDKFYKYKFEIFQEFLKKMDFIFYYLYELLKFDLIDETKYFVNDIIKRVTNMIWTDEEEFIRTSTPYYIVMSFGALFLKNDHPELTDLFYTSNVKYSSMAYGPLMTEISYESDAWGYIGKENYQKKYYFPKYSIIQEYLLPPVVSPQEFNYFDAYITFDFVERFPDTLWINGSAMYPDDFTYAYFEHFDSKIGNKDNAKDFITKLADKYRANFRMNRTRGIRRLADALKTKYGF